MRAGFIVVYIILAGLILGTVFGCDSKDNDWGTYDPDLKVVSLQTDTLAVSEDGQTAEFDVSIGMVPEDTVRILILPAGEELTVAPETLLFVPVDDEWSYPQTVVVSAIDDPDQEGLHHDAVTILAESTDDRYDLQSGEGPVAVAVADNDSAGVLISESSLTLVESDDGTVRETYRVRLRSRPSADVAVAVGRTPEEPSFHIEPSLLTFTPENWNVDQEVLLWIELDDLDNDDLVITLDHGATSIDPDYGPQLAIPDLVVATYDFTLPPIARLRLESSDLLQEADLTATALVRVQLTRSSALPVVVHLGTQDGTATAPGDYVVIDQDLTFTPGGALFQDVVVAASDDDIIEPEESFGLVITPGENVIIGEDDRVILRVTDDDLTPLSMTVTNVNEDSGAADFVVSIPFPETVPVGFTFSTANGTAIAGVDYESHSRTYIFEPGQTMRTIPVVLNADPYHEGDETFTASLSHLTENAAWNGVPVVCTILGDDPQSVSMADITVNETDGEATFTLVMQAPYERDLILTAGTLDGDGVEPATDQIDAVAGQDFTALHDEPWTIPTGETSGTISVTLHNESQAESLSEYFRIELTSGSEPGFTGVGALATLIDDDQPCLFVADVQANEFDAEAVFTVRILNENLNPVTSTGDIRFHVETLDQTATGGMDYTTVSENRVIPAGLGSIDVVVPLTDDVHDDDSETFVLVLTEFINATGSCGTDDAFCTLEDDEYPALNIRSTVTRLNEGSVWTYDVFLTTPRQHDTTFDMTLSEGTSQGPAVDYSFAQNGTHIIPAMVESLTFTVPFLDDQLSDEPDEMIRVDIGNADVALGLRVMEATIVDAPEISIGSASANEGDWALFDVFLDAPSTAEITFMLQFANDTATMGDDFNIADVGPHTFLAGETTTTVPVEIYAGDGGDATVEVFVITVVTPTNATVSENNSGLGYITDMDPPEIYCAGNATAQEGRDVEFTVNLSWTSEVDVSFEVDYFDGTAVRAGVDYDDSNGGPFTVLAGQTAVIVPVPTVADGSPELSQEDFSILIHTPTHGIMGSPLSATGFIVDIDQPELTIPAPALTVEGGDLVFGIHMDRPTAVPVFFSLDWDAGSTQGAGDFVPPTTAQLSMMPGTTDTTVTISTIDDGVFEGPEAFILRLADPINAVLGMPFENTGVINDND